MTIDSSELPAKWMPLVKRLAGMAHRECGQHGFAVMTVNVLVSPQAEPVFWGEPTFNKLEPRLGAFQFLNEILRIYGEKPPTEE